MTSGPWRPAPLRYHLRHHPWRYLAHRAGLIYSPTLLYTDVPFSNRWHRRRRILARIAAHEATCKGCN
ncbi:hypothetical protein [Streptomyces nitrosporeus]|uniref:hypothetical protein n=1 Tax=Streptomyces nitrosporeus TaxID=28894 RepID=UPI0039A0C6BA